MPVTIKKVEMAYKDENGQYHGIDTVAETSTAEQVSAIQAAGNNQISRINTKTQQSLASISDVAELESMIEGVFVASNNYKAGKYVIQEVSGVNKLYKFTADYTANDGWSNASVVEAKIGDDVSDLKSALIYNTGEVMPEHILTDTGNNWTYSFDPTNNYALTPDGYSYLSTGWKLYKYAYSITMCGSVLHIKADGYFQFQTNVSVPASGTQYIVGGTHPAFDAYAEWIDDATYLVISSKSEPYIHSCSVKRAQETINDDKTQAEERQVFNKDAYPTQTALTAAYTTESRRIKPNGYSCFDANYTIYKYGIGSADRGKVYRIKANGVCQFQTSLTVPMTGDQYIVGGTYNADDIYLICPSDAGYLIVSSTSTPLVYACGEVENIRQSIYSIKKLISGEISAVVREEYSEKSIAAGWTSASAYLDDDGYYVPKAGWTVYKYTLLANSRNTVVHVVGGFQIQFQTGIGITPGGAGTIISGPFRNDDAYFVWPVTATYLMVCAQSEPTVYICTDQNDMLLSDTFNPASESSQGENVGTDLRIMSYNVAHYNYDTSVYISDDKMLNFRQLIAKTNADIVCTQEDQVYVDGDDSTGSKASVNYLYYPVYPALQSGGSQAMIHSKKNQSTSSHFALCYATKRWLDYVVIEYGSKKLLVVSTHLYPGSDATGVTNRSYEYNELFQWIAGTIDLLEYKATDDAEWIHVPEHTHCIVCMDGNIETATDRTNLSTAASGADCILGNGGRFGWFKTSYNAGTGARGSIDNIIVSDNVIINDIDVLWDWFWRLYSDHAPVVADVTLL